MKKSTALALILLLLLAGCGGPETPPADGTDIQEVKTEGELTPVSDDKTELPDDLPSELACEDDLTGEGGYLLLGQLPEQDIALYCDNSEERTTAYIRYGGSFQPFEQKAWEDPTVLPELTWEDWDGDGENELTVEYLRHEGTYFDGEKNMPGLVCERVVYQWDGEKWVDIHFSSSGPIRTAVNMP